MFRPPAPGSKGWAHWVANVLMQTGSIATSIRKRPRS